MRKKVSAAIGLFFLLSACAAMEPLSVREEKYGKASPVITQSFASAAMDPRVTWKIYLRASDADGDMRRMVVTFGKNEGVGSEIAWTPIPPEERRELSGYLYWHPGPNALFSMYGFMTVRIEDLAGHLSNAVSFPIEFRAGARQESPPAGVFREKALGPVMIRFRPSGGNGSASSP